MDIQTQMSWERGTIPERYYNQLNTGQNITETYIREKQRSYNELTADPTDSNNMTIHIESTYKEV